MAGFRARGYRDGACHRRGNDMRQWELFGITDSQPTWTPPKREVSDTIRLVTPEPDEGEQEQLVSA